MSCNSKVMIAAGDQTLSRASTWSEVDDEWGLQGDSTATLELPRSKCVGGASLRGLGAELQEFGGFDEVGTLGPCSAVSPRSAKGISPRGVHTTAAL